jgi:hypothetical protein
VNVFFWILQAALALHTAVGAVWKFSHSAEQTMPSLKAIPPGVWMGMSLFELLCVVGLILPAIHKPLGVRAPMAAVFIAAEMAIFCGLHLGSGDPNRGPMVYWLVVAVICAIIAYGRFVLKPF